MSLHNIYVINVKKFAERRIFMENQLRSFGLKAEFILDGDIEDLNEQICEDFFPTSNITPAQQSCAYKHILVLQNIVENNLSCSLVLEDDAVFAKNFHEGVDRALSEKDEFKGNKVIYIGSGGNFFTPKSQRKPGQYLYPGHRGRFTDSYIIDAETAKKRLQWIRQNKVTEPIDNLFDQMDKELNIQVLWLEDPVVEQGSKNGLFHSEVEQAPPNWLQALKFAWEKLRRKYIYQLWR